MVERVETPQKIKKQMDLWREGLIAIPDEYIDFHRKLAEEELEKIKEYGFEVEDKWMSSDGWLDGMRVLYVDIKDLRTGEIYKIAWDDGNQEYFYSGGVGSSPLRLQDGFEFLKEV